jgi:hypothetical protein
MDRPAAFVRQRLRKTVMTNQTTSKNSFAHSFARRRAGLGLVCCVLVAFFPAMSSAQSESPPRVVTLPAPAQQFFAAVRANFATWDLNHDGRLTREEIELDMQNARITGDAAAALAALKLGATHSNHLPDTRTYALPDIDAMEQELQAGRKLDPNFVNFFVTGLKKLKEVPRQLFSEGIPRLTAIRQDWTSDCYFLSTLGAMAQVDPQAIARLIMSNRDGTFTVTFPGKPALRIPAPTDAELATYSNARDGVWLSVLEKAYAIIRIKAEPAQASTGEPLDSVGFRTGNPAAVQELMTGRPSKTIKLPADSHRPADDRLLQDIRSGLQSAFREHRAVVLGNSHHDYTIVTYDATSDMITIHNPYGRGGFETWADGGKGARTDEGFFTMSTAQLVNYFNYLSFALGGHAS